MNEELGIMNGGTCRPFLKRGFPSIIHHSSFGIRHSSRRAFTLIEMLVVIGIIAILVGVSLTSFRKMSKTADNTQAQELVSQAATALAAIYEADGMWPKLIREASKSTEEDKGVLGNEEGNEVARILAKRGYMSMSMKDGKLVGKDRYGILTPWAAKKLENASSTDIQANILKFAVDLNGDGVIDNEECGKRIEKYFGKKIEYIRATVMVWCPDKKGEGYIKSWTKNQEQIKNE